MHSTRPNRFSTSGSLRRLRTAFSTSPRRSISPNSTTSTYTYTSSAASIRDMLSLRRKPSVLEFEMEEEAHLFGTELEVLEPRPRSGRMGDGNVAMVGIFEVLDGKC